MPNFFKRTHNLARASLNLDTDKQLQCIVQTSLSKYFHHLHSFFQCAKGSVYYIFTLISKI